MTDNFDIQVIDDQSEELTVLRGILSTQGYRVRTSITGEMALTSAFDAPPDLILLDIMMPGMDGFEVCRRLKADDRTCDIPVLFLSGRVEVEHKVNAFTAGGVDYITKPFQKEEVLARVATHLALHNIKKQLELQNIQLQQINHELIQEITERKQAEATLRESEARYRQIFETNLAVKLIINPADGRIIAANEAACQFYGYSVQTLTSLQITDINILSGEEVQQEMARAKTEERLFFNFRHRLASGEIRDVEVYSGPLQSGGETLLYSIIHDVTERKRAEETLQENERLLRQITANYPNSYLSIIEKDYTVGFTSGQEFTKRNLDPAQFTGLTLEQVFGDQAVIIRQYYKKAFNGEESTFELFIDNQHQLYRVVPLYATDGSISRVLAVVENITKRKEAAQMLQAKNEELQAALNYVKQLSGLLPICASCKKIRDDEGYWQDVAVYIRDHSEAEFSHGICPDCAKALYPEFYKGGKGA